MKIDTSFYLRCIQTLDRAYQLLTDTDQESIEYDMYRSACVKEFEIILEQTGKLLKVSLKPFFSSAQQVEKLIFKDIFRQANKHGLITKDETERWFHYRDNRNNTAHDYGIKFAQETLKLIPSFIQDAHSIEQSLRGRSYD